MIAIDGRSSPFLRKHTFSAILEERRARNGNKIEIEIWTSAAGRKYAPDLLIRRGHLSLFAVPSPVVF